MNLERSSWERHQAFVVVEPFFFVFFRSLSGVFLSLIAIKSRRSSFKTAYLGTLPPGFNCLFFAVVAPVFRIRAETEIAQEVLSLVGI
jgi:hypothetical protein